MRLFIVCLFVFLVIASVLVSPVSPPPQEGGGIKDICADGCPNSIVIIRASNDPGSHEWQYDASSSDIWNEMLVTERHSTMYEDVFLVSLTLAAGGTGDDSKDILRIELYVDVNKNGVVDSGDLLLASKEPAYSQDNGKATLNIAPRASERIAEESMIIAYVMSQNAPIGKTYYLTFESVKNDVPAAVKGLPMLSGTTTITGKPQQCSGLLAFAFDPNAVFADENATAKVSGLENCDDVIMNVSKEQCTTSAQIQCSCKIANGACACNLSAPGQKGDYTYYACMDLNNNDAISSEEQVSAGLKVKEKENDQPSPDPSPMPTPVPGPECKTDEKCDDDEHCVEEKCEPITGMCGTVVDHAWQTYECGDEASCKPCAAGNVCREHKCFVVDIKVPDKTDVGMPVNVTVLVGGQPAADAKILLTDPNGATVTLTTDKTGKGTFTPTYKGKYEMSTLGKSKTLTAQEIGSVPKDVVSEIIAYISEDPVRQYSLVAIIVLVFAGLIWYFKFRRRP